MESNTIVTYLSINKGHVPVFNTYGRVYAIFYSHDGLWPIREKENLIQAWGLDGGERGGGSDDSYSCRV